jgi:hypothetical protein
MILVRNCPHNNGIHTLIDELQGIVIKSSTTDDGIIRLRREHAGYEWYFKQLARQSEGEFKIVLNDNGRYARLCIDFFPGHEGIYHKNLSHNRKRILLAINIYLKVWPRLSDTFVPLHGDFSLGNLIFHEDSLTIIDWEHFQRNAAPWGVDLANLIYESTFFSFNGGDTLSRTDRLVFAEARKVVCDLLEPQEGFNCTLENLTHFISTNVHLWGSSVDKLPVLKFTTVQKEYLKKLEH